MRGIQMANHFTTQALDSRESGWDQRGQTFTEVQGVEQLGIVTLHVVRIGHRGRRVQRAEQKYQNDKYHRSLRAGEEDRAIPIFGDQCTGDQANDDLCMDEQAFVRRC